MKKEDLIGLYEILENNLSDVNENTVYSQEDLEVFKKMEELKKAIDNLN